jgi:outer membrane autotransporter protein
MDGSIPLVGSGAGKMGVLQVEGNLAFKKICVLAKENNDVVNENANVSFRIVQYGGSYHNYIVIDGGEKNNPCEIKLNGCTLTLADTDEDGGRVLEKINTQDSSQLILVKEKSFAKIIGSDDPGNPGCLALDLHGDHAKKVALIRLENDASIVLDPLNIEAGEHDAIIAGNNNKILFLDTDPVTLKGNITGGSGLTFVFMLSNDEKKSKADTIFDWKSGKLAIPEGAKVNFAIDTAFDSIRGGRKRMQDFLNAYKQAHPAIKFINLADNAANKVAILAALSLEITGHLIDGVKLAKDDDGNIIVNLENAATASLEKLLGGVAPYLSDSFAKLLENAYENGNQTVIERGILEYLNLNEARVLPAFSKTTTEEKNRMTLTLINSIRETVYSKLGGEFFGDKHYNVWASGFGNAARNGSLSSYKMNCDIFGFATGIDWRVNNNLLVGVLGGYGKAKAKYKGEIHLENKPSKCNLESYFGGIYGMWDEFIEDISVKFSLMAGHGKYNEQYSLPLIDTVGIAPISSSPEGHWISGNIDCTYKHWNFYGLNVGPWVSLSVATIHQKSKTERLENDAPPTDSHFERKIAAADRRSIETTIGVAADYDLSMGILELAIGYKHEFRNLKKGKVSLYETYNNSNYKIVAHGDGPAEFFEFDPFNVSTGKDSFVGKVSWNMQFGDFGLTLGGHTQLGNHFKDIAGSITASYSF